ncbi:MAG: porin [Rubrivivax sp.]|nr:porin [Rubrivivax sp.]
MRTTRRAALTLAAAISVGLPYDAAQAQASVKLYGHVDLSVGSFQDAGRARVKELAGGKLSTSHVGLSGNEDLGGGLRAEFVLEQFLRADTGTSGRFNGDAFWSRNAFVSLGASAGTLRLGRITTPLFVSTLIFNPFGDSFGFSPAIRQVFTPATGQPFLGDSGWNSAAQYTSPSLGGLTLAAMVNAGEGAAGATGGNLSAAARYFAGPVGVAATWQRVRNGAVGAPAGWRDQQTAQLAGSYDFGAVKAFAQYTRVDTAAAVSTDADIYGAGIAAPAGSGRILLAYGRASAALAAGAVTSQTVSAGYRHSLSRRTELYAVLMTDRLTSRSNGNTAAGGMLHRF